MIKTIKKNICKQCGDIGGKYNTRKDVLSSGKIVFYPYKECILCVRENARDKYFRNLKNPGYQEKNREYQRDYYKKNYSKKNMYLTERI